MLLIEISTLDAFRTMVVAYGNVFRTFRATESGWAAVPPSGIESRFDPPFLHEGFRTHCFCNKAGSFLILLPGEDFSLRPVLEPLLVQHLTTN